MTFVVNPKTIVGLIKHAVWFNNLKLFFPIDIIHESLPCAFRPEPAEGLWIIVLKICLAFKGAQLYWIFAQVSNKDREYFPDLWNQTL